MLVSELMSRCAVTVCPEDTAEEASLLMTRYNIGALPVCSDNGALLGIITDRDIITRCIATLSDPVETPVRDIMSKLVLRISPGDTVVDASRLMSEHRVRRLPVTENGRLVGMLSLCDMARTRKFDTEASAALSEISSNLLKL